jgi:porphobilinogen deaminase
VESAKPVKGERRLLEKLDGGCQLPFGVNIRPAGDGYHLDLYYAPPAGGAPLRLALDGDDPLALADAAYARIRAHEGTTD